MTRHYGPARSTPEEAMQDLANPHLWHPMSTAQEIGNTLAVSAYGDFPCSLTRWLEIEYNGTHDQYKTAPAGIRFMGYEYGKASHNSDTKRIVYRTDKLFAYTITG